jgi:TRAP-type mannitol/chloroaromatic compound transport system permease large subunit
MALFLITFFVCLMIGIPIALALGMSSLVYLILTDNLALMAILPQRMLGSVNNFVLLTIPLFLLCAAACRWST